MSVSRFFIIGNSLVIQSLRLGVSLLWTQVQFLVRELRSHKLFGEAKKKNCLHLKDIMATSWVGQKVHLCVLATSYG